MTDREMYELAAKAAGPKFDGYAWSDEFRCMVKPTGLSGGEDFTAPVYTWDPRNSNNDSFDLQVILGCRVNTSDVMYENGPLVSCAARDDYSQPQSVPHGDNPSAASRLAIFLVAVDVGKSMQ